MRSEHLSGRWNLGAAKAAPRCRSIGRMRPVHITACVAWLLATTGCYSYTVIDPGRAGAGTEVRARITPEAAVRIAEIVGTNGRVLQGEVVGTESAGLVLSVPSVVPADGAAGPRLHQRVTLPSAAIVELEERRLDRVRTFSLLGAVAVVGGYIVASQFGLGGDEPGGDKPGPENVLVPLLRIRIR